MLTQIRNSFSLLDRRAKLLVKLFALMRILIVGLDTLGVILIGLLVTKSAATIDNQSNEATNILSNFLGFTDNFTLVEIAFFALILFTLKSIMSIIFTKLMSIVLANSETTISSIVFNKLINGKYENLSHYSRQDLVYALTSSASFAVTEMLSIFITLLSEAALLIAIGLLFAFVDFKVAFGIFIYFGLVGFLIHSVIGPKMHQAGSLYADSVVKSNTAINDAIAAFREVYTLKKHSEFAAKFKKGRVGIAKPIAAVNFYSGLPRYIVETTLMFGAVFLAIYLFASRDAASAAGILGIFLTGSVRIMASMLPLQNSLSNLKRFQSASESFFQLAKSVENYEDKFPKSMNPIKTTIAPIGVVFEKVSYRYPASDIDVIQEMDLNIKAGDYVALIGPSGAGKSTIADLMIRLINPTNGKVSYIGPGESEVRIGYVPQSPGIVSGTILENITLSVDSGDFEEQSLRKAIIDANLSELINTLSEGVNASLGSQSDGFSGGQLQRIGLARALYGQPALLILDEATSALDPETESAFAQTLNELKGKCTIVVMAHRLSTVKNADCVFVVDQGKIVASGKFNDLAKSNELVARYVELSQLNLN